MRVLEGEHLVLIGREDGKQQLDNLVQAGQLNPEPPAQEEIAGLFHSGTRRLDDAAREDLELESRF